MANLALQPGLGPTQDDFDNEPVLLVRLNFGDSVTTVIHSKTGCSHFSGTCLSSTAYYSHAENVVWKRSFTGTSTT
jgi:hypothetical protein